ncbi:MAG TPA: CocE/NonD family hydrolase [Solirubrobacteraceae bacterium]
MGDRLLKGLIAFALTIGASAGTALADSTTVSSFDGTKIHVNYFPAPGLGPGARNATVLLGPGWSSPGDTSTTDSTDTSTGIPGVGTMLRAGFNVVTWDPRGFGSSGGMVESDSPAYEGRDVSAIITWLAKQPQALLDAPGNPRVGMVGGSYGGGIQLDSAAIDPRIDAIVPDIAWNSLVTSLYKEQTVKQGWANILYVLGKGNGHLDPMIDQSYETGLSGRPLTPAEVNFYATRGPGSLVSKIKIPTLLIQGTADNLFTLQEAVTNYSILRHDGVPVKMLWFCGGHGICLTNPGDTSLIDKDTIAWLDRYLGRERGVSTGPTFEWVDENGAERTGGDYPLAPGTPISAQGSGTLPITNAGGSGPVVPKQGASATASVAAPITPAKAASAVNVTIPAPHTTQLVVGAPELTITYSGTGSGENGTSARVFAQVVDDATGLVLGNQITPVPITLDGATHTFGEPLEVLSATRAPGQTFTLQLTASTVAYAAQRETGTVSFSKIAIELPTVDPSAAPPGYGAVAPNGCTDGGVVRIAMPKGTRSGYAAMGRHVIARGRRALKLDLVGLGSGPVRIRIVTVGRTGHRRVATRTLRACP